MGYVKPTYEKPKGVSYVQMAMWIDEHMYDENQSDEIQTQIFIYLYHLANMLAYKQRLFSSGNYYDDFAIYVASQAFMRIKNPKQYSYDENGKPKMPHLKSSLNYLKTILYPAKVNFEQDNYAQTIIQVNADNDDGIFDLNYSLADKLANSIDAKSVSDFKECLGDVIITSKAFLKQIPYITDKKEWHNIYISCLLTFNNSITLRKADIERLKSNPDRAHLIEDLYARENKDSTILYHLDESMRDYITILVRELKHVIAKDLSLQLHRYIPSEEGIKDLILAEVNNLHGNIEEGI